MILNDLRKSVNAIWNELPNHYQESELDEYMVIPNHIHGIVIINDIDIVGARHASPLRDILPN